MSDPKDPAAPQADDRPAATPGALKPRDDASWDDDEGENWRHAPAAPKDQGVPDSLGRAVSDAVTGSAPEGTVDKGKTPGRS